MYTELRLNWLSAKYFTIPKNKILQHELFHVYADVYANIKALCSTTVDLFTADFNELASNSAGIANTI